MEKFITVTQVSESLTASRGRQGAGGTYAPKLNQTNGAAGGDPFFRASPAVAVDDAHWEIAKGGVRG